MRWATQGESTVMCSKDSYAFMRIKSEANLSCDKGHEAACRCAAVTASGRETDKRSVWCGVSWFMRIKRVIARLGISRFMARWNADMHRHLSGRCAGSASLARRIQVVPAHDCSRAPSSVAGLCAQTSRLGSALYPRSSARLSKPCTWLTRSIHHPPHDCLAAPARG